LNLRPEEKSVTDAGMADAFGSEVQHMFVHYVPKAEVANNSLSGSTGSRSK
jgi:hypothetical protein